MEDKIVGTLSIEIANSIPEELLLRMKANGYRLVYLVNQAIIVKKPFYQPKRILGGEIIEK